MWCVPLLPVIFGGIQMIIIVEGIDRIGKTTLCNLLSSTYKIPIYRHIGERDLNAISNNTETEKLLQISEICRLSDAFIIFDRFYFSDYVYGRVERGYDIYKADRNFKTIDDFIANDLKDAILILVSPTDINKSSQEHGRDLNKHDALFNYLYERSAITNKFNCNYNTLQKAIEFVGSKINNI